MLALLFHMSKFNRFHCLEFLVLQVILKNFLDDELTFSLSIINFKFFIWHKKDKIRNCFSFLPNCWMSFLFSAKEFAFIRVMLKFSSFSPVAFCSMGVRLSPTPPPPCTLCGWCINNRGCVKFLFWCVGSSLYISDIFRLSAGKRHSIKSWYTLLKLSLLISPAKHFSCLLIPQIAKFSSCWKFRHFLIGQEMTKLPVTASRTGKPFLFCILLSPGRAPVTEALHDVYDYHQWALPLHQVEKESSVFASAVAGGKFSFIPSFFNLNWNLQKVLPDVGRSTF